MYIIKREVTTFPNSEDGKKCAQLYFKRLKSQHVKNCKLVADDEGQHVSGQYLLAINEKKMLEDSANE